MELDELIWVLEKSVEKHGEKPLTNKWLLNIVKMAQKNCEEDEHPWDWVEPDDIFLERLLTTPAKTCYH